MGTIKSVLVSQIKYWRCWCTTSPQLLVLRNQSWLNTTGRGEWRFSPKLHLWEWNKEPYGAKVITKTLASSGLPGSCNFREKSVHMCYEVQYIAIFAKFHLWLDFCPWSLAHSYTISVMKLSYSALRAIKWRWNDESPEAMALQWPVPSGAAGVKGSVSTRKMNVEVGVWAAPKVWWNMAWFCREEPFGVTKHSH